MLFCYFSAAFGSEWHTPTTPIPTDLSYIFLHLSRISILFLLKMSILQFNYFYSLKSTCYSARRFWCPRYSKTPRTWKKYSERLECQGAARQDLGWKIFVLSYPLLSECDINFSCVEFKSTYCFLGQHYCSSRFHRFSIPPPPTGANRLTHNTRECAHVLSTNVI